MRMPLISLLASEIQFTTTAARVGDAKLKRVGGDGPSCRRR